MPSRLFRLHFDRVHFGDRGLGRSTVTLTADTLFAALATEILKRDGQAGLAELVGAVHTGTLRLTDAFPFAGKEIFLPKPLIQVSADLRDPASASRDKKAAKKIDFVPLRHMPEFLAARSDLSELAEMQGSIGDHAVAERVSLRHDGEDAEPYRVGLFSFRPGSGLWLIASGAADEVRMVEQGLSALQYVGLGGERSSGYGRFTVETEPPPQSLHREPPAQQSLLMLLSTALPADDEMGRALEGARYRLHHRGGFVASPTFAPTLRRKRALVKLAAGSVFQHAFRGSMPDVGVGGSHPVWSYSMASFMSLAIAAPNAGRRQS